MITDLDRLGIQISENMVGKTTRGKFFVQMEITQLSGKTFDTREEAEWVAQSLKSQLESKLAQPERKTNHKYPKSDNRIIQAKFAGEAVFGETESVYNTNDNISVQHSLEQELSQLREEIHIQKIVMGRADAELNQLRPIVKAIREEMKSHITGFDESFLLDRIESILATTEDGCKHENTEFCPNLAIGITCRVCKECGKHIREVNQ